MTLVDRLARLLERVFLGSSYRASTVEAGSGLLLESAGARARAHRAPARAVLVPRPDDPFLLTVDDAGQYLVALPDRLVLGHMEGGLADLPFLADVGARHAVLQRRRSFRAGTTWSIAPFLSDGDRRVDRVRVGSREVEGETTLADGDEVRLGDAFAFLFRVPDPASSSVLLELKDEAECGGASRILLLDAGEGGVLRIGSSLHRHVRVPNLEHEVTILREEGRLLVRCAGGTGEAEEGLSVPRPVLRRLDLVLGKPVQGRPPFGISIAPSDLARPGRGAGAPE